MHLEPRQHASVWIFGAASVGASVGALALCGLLILWAQAPVLKAYELIVVGALGQPIALADTLTRATPLIFTGLAVAVGFRARVWNIGAEGQLYAGAMTSIWIGAYAHDLPSVVLIPILMIVGALAGGLLLVVPIILKLKLALDEVVTTLLLNFVMLPVVNYLIFNPWKDPMAMGWPRSVPVVPEGMLPKLVSGTNLSVGLLIGCGCAVVLWLIIRFSVLGFEMRAVGANPHAAAFAGIPVGRTMLITAMMSGGLAGLAGVVEVIGTNGYLTLDLSSGYGYTGIAVAMLAALHPIGTVFAALFVAMIYIGADSMSQTLGVSSYLADVISATILLAVLGSTLLVRYRLVPG
jgi:general nucleoside transport system permease protein